VDFVLLPSRRNFGGTCDEDGNRRIVCAPPRTDKNGHALKASSSCESLSSLALPNTSITLAQVVPAGAFTLPGTGPAAPQFSHLPTFCRVTATLTPSSDSDIKIEVWLPAADWNGKFQAVGNGGWAGTITYDRLAAALREGYATASTDTGHAGANASFALGHPEKIVDFAYRAVHEMAVKSKAIIAAFYGHAPRFSYWTGCSTGGRQALMEAQRYPEDFDGIIAGAPANNPTQLCVWRIAVEARILQSPASVVPPAKLVLLNRAVLAACDAIDGVTDGLLDGPTPMPVRSCNTFVLRLRPGRLPDGATDRGREDGVRPGKTKDGGIDLPRISAWRRNRLGHVDGCQA